MSGATGWAGGNRLNDKLKESDLLTHGAMPLISSLDGAHQITRQLLGEMTGAIKTDLSWHRQKIDKQITFHPKFFKHLTAFLDQVNTELDDSMVWAADDDTRIEIGSIRKQVITLKDTLTSSCEENVEIEKIMCKDSMPNDVIALNSIMANIHKNLEKALVTGIKNTDLGNSSVKEQCMIVVPKGQPTPEFASSFCQPEYFNNVHDMNAFVLACPSKGMILLRRLNVMAGENQGLHTTQIDIGPKDWKIRPNINSDVEDHFRSVMTELGAKESKTENVWTRKFTNFNQVTDDMKVIGQNLKFMIRPNSGMPMSHYGIMEDQI